jgi:hypothetical protein
MAVIAKNQILVPFLSSKLNYITGQDPMGMLNIGEQVFTMLLPGLNNVTDRIRYYSFYCWFFDWYAKDIGSENPKEQYKYVRRAEYLLALIAASQDMGGIAGITEAKKNYTNNLYSLSHGTGEDKDDFENTYWKNAKGVFGQNYVSSLRVIGLIRDKENNSNLYIRTAFKKENIVSGKELAQAFIENIESINPNAHEVFIKALTSATVNQEEIVLLQESFNMKSVAITSTENQLLRKMLLGNDEPFSELPTKFRKKTTLLYLQLLQNKKSRLTVQEFVQFAYEQQGFLKGENDETLTAWYYYQLSQYWHVINTGGLMHLLNALHDKSEGSWYIEEQLIREITQEVVAELVITYNCNSNHSFTELPVLEKDNNSISSDINTKDYVLGLCNAFLLLKKISVENKEQIESLTLFAKKHHLESSSDFVAVYSLVEKMSALPLNDFIAKYLKKYIIDRHQLVAFNKMTNVQTSEKFVREDGLIRFLDFVGFDFSNPRLSNLIDYYTELGIITKDYNQLTNEGIELLKDLELND